MASNPIVWLVLGPVLLAAVAPMLRAACARWQPSVHASGHALILLLALGALLAPPEVVAIAIRTDAVGAQIALNLTHVAALQIALAAALIAAISFFSDRIVRESRHGAAFLSLLALEQTAVNVVILSNDLLGLYAGLMLLSLTLMLMLGLDFSAEGRDAALRVFATLEVPAAVALASFWLISASSGPPAFANPPAWLPGLPPATALSLTLPIAVALISRAALAPLHHWVIVGCRRAAAPVTIAIAGIAVPLGGVVLARAVPLVASIGPDWLLALALLGAATALIGGLGALSEKNALGWLGYLAVAQVGFAAVGFASGTDAGRLAGWLGLAGGALGITITGLGLTGAIQITRSPNLAHLAQAPVDWLSTIILVFGALSLAPLPPFMGFHARVALLAGLFDPATGPGWPTALLVTLATLLVAAGALRLPLALARQSPVPSPMPIRATFAAPIILAGLSAVLGIIPLTWLAPIVGVSLPPPAGVGGDLRGVALITLALGGALYAGRLRDVVTGRVRISKRVASRLAGIQRSHRIERAGDPYLIIGGSLLALGKASAAFLNHTLGRLARAG